jgi:hypothetical protein
VARVGFERHILKPGLIFKGKGLKAVAFELWVNRVQLAPPPTAASLASVLWSRNPLICADLATSRCVGLALPLPEATGWLYGPYRLSSSSAVIDCCKITR